jgi:hypothetical protein
MSDRLILPYLGITEFSVANGSRRIYQVYRTICEGFVQLLSVT